MSAPAGVDGPRRFLPLGEGVLLLAVVLPLALSFHLAGLWLLAPLSVITVTGRPFERFGLSWQRPGRLRWHVWVSVGVFVPFVLGFWLWESLWNGASFQFRLPPQLLWSVIDQMLLIALPEEFFFRGYLQTQFDQTFGTPFRVLGVRCGWGLPLAAGLFALCHVAHGGPARLSVFFPGLWYGWLRAGTGTIAVPTAYHAVSNLLLAWLLASVVPG